MKTKHHTLLFIIAFAGLMLPGILNAQYTKLCEYSGSTTGSDPYGSLVSDGTFLYGMTSEGGDFGNGTVFRIMPDGTNDSILLAFNGVNGRGAKGSLIYEGGFLYGMTYEGGTNNKGVIFKIQPDGTNYSKLLDFNGVNGHAPYGSLVSDGVFLYGMTLYGGASDLGVVFKIKTDGTGYSKLLDFNGLNGQEPYGSLFFDGTYLYGMTSAGGLQGTIFKIKPDGTGYFKLLDFQGPDGVWPYATLVSDGTFLYGTTRYGGTAGAGTIFKIMPDGTGYSKIYDFSGVPGFRGSLIYDGTSLYGMTENSGPSYSGNVFKIQPDGTGYTSILNFNGSNGKNPRSSLIADGIFLYGMTIEGGTMNAGTIFKIKPDGTSYTNLFDFDNYSNPPNGAYPRGPLVSDSTFLYGVGREGGTSGKGVILKIKPDGTECSVLFDFSGSTVGGPTDGVFSDGTYFYGAANNSTLGGFGGIYKIKIDGTGFTQLHAFSSYSTGIFPVGSLISDGTFLYGMTSKGGTGACSFGCGLIYKIKTDGTAYSILHSFSNTIEGRNPSGSLIFDGTFLYGMTGDGGANGMGTIFKLKSDGTGFTKLLDFAGTNGCLPFASNLLSDGTFLYGVTGGGGANDHGTIFKIMTDGTGYSKLFDFDSINGSNPSNALIFDGAFLYGMTLRGGISAACYSGCGTAFKIKPDGTGFAKILDFDGLSNGNDPRGAFYSDGVFLYGTTSGGGTYNYGTVFKIVIPVVGIAEKNSAIEFKIYPNPSKGPFIIEIKEKEFWLSITNVLGEKVYKAEIKNQKIEIDLSKQPSGVYFINVQTEKGSGTQKIIIQH